MNVALIGVPLGLVRLIVYFVPSGPGGTASSIRDELMESTFTKAGNEFAVDVIVNSWAGHLDGKPLPVNTIDPPLTDPVYDVGEKAPVNVSASELVSPTG